VTNDPQPVRDGIEPIILALNNAHAVELSWLDAAQLKPFLREAFYARQIADGEAFLLAFDQRAKYESPNYLWFRQRYHRFVYVDRVVVSPLMRGRGYARALYTDLFARARQEGHTLVVCEVNSEPPIRRRMLSTRRWASPKSVAPPSIRVAKRYAILPASSEEMLTVGGHHGGGNDAMDRCIRLGGTYAIGRLRQD
jgi:predicted GNAT superfamily acetyltransferase